MNSKNEFLTLLKKIIEPLPPLYTPERAGLNIGQSGTYYDNTTVLMEGFARILWGLVPAWHGGADLGEDFKKIYRQGLASGTNPKSSEYWGKCHDCDQYFVEMAVIAYGLILCPEILWEPLNDKEKDNLTAWLNQINEHKLCESNWQLFGVMVNTALKKLGRKYDNERMEEELNMFERWYLGGGWYTDGSNDRCDYYISFAIHFYCLFYAAVMADEDPKRSALYKSRATKFAKDFIYWFSDNGEAVAYGRSQTYRFAQCAFWGACVFAGIEPFPLGVIKGIISRNLEEWMSNPIFDRDGVLTIGYRYPNLIMTEAYNAPGSPYWGLKSMIILALPDNHKFWSEDILPLPRLENVKTLPNARMIMTRSDGHVCMFTSGKFGEPCENLYPPKYAKFVYSSKYGFSVPRTNYTLNDAAADSMLLFETGGYFYPRKESLSCVISDGQISTVWSPTEDIVVTTKITPTPNGHIREHTIESGIDCIAYDSGFALPRFESKTEYSDNTAKVYNDNGYCSVTGDGSAIIMTPSPNTNLMTSCALIPSIQYTVNKGTNKIKTIVEYK